MAKATISKECIANLQAAITACWEADDVREQADIVLTSAIDDIRLDPAFPEWSKQVVKQRTDENRALTQVALACYVAHTKAVPSKPTLSKHVRALIDAIIGRTDAQMQDGKKISWAKIRNGASARGNRTRNPAEPSNPTVSGITEPKGFWVLSVDKKASAKTKLQLVQAFAEKIGVTL